MVSGVASGQSAFLDQFSLNAASDRPEGWPQPTPAINLGLEVKWHSSMLNARLFGASWAACGNTQSTPTS